MADNTKLQATLKSLLYAGVGFAAETSTKVQKNVDDLIKKGKINEREGKKIVDHVVLNADAKRKELEVKLNKIVDQYGKTGISQIQSLTKKIQKLEADLSKRIGGSKSAAKPVVAAKKAVKKVVRKAAKRKPAAKKAVAKVVAAVENAIA